MIEMDRDIKSFRKEILDRRNQSKAGFLLSYEEAIEEIRENLKVLIKEENKRKNDGKVDFKKNKDKKYLKKNKGKFREYIKEIVAVNNIRVKGYDHDKIDEFVEEAVSLFAGFDILEDAYQNPDVTDIYVIDYNKIFIEENGVNKKYHKNFRSREHFKTFMYRLLNEAGKELNVGDSKKADFELYGDRYCATSPAISPEGYSLTIRKHSEEHITFNQLLEGELLNEEIADFIGKIIKGERNIVYAGLTGSGKTTSIRAFLDHFVPELNKRMIVCEDTQELFPKSEHTLELVSAKTGDPKTEMTLQQLVYTSLRLKPKYIVVGEVRAEEAQAASEAMETGHSTIFTMHGGKAVNCINRVVTKYLTSMPSLGIEVVERIIGSSIDYIFIQDNIPGIGRKITEVSEISYDFDKRTVSIKPIFKFNFEKELFERVDAISKDKAEMMLRRGVKMEEIKRWMNSPKKKEEKNVD